MTERSDQDVIDQEFTGIVEAIDGFTDAEFHDYLSEKDYSKAAILGHFGIAKVELTATDVRTVNEMRQHERQFGVALSELVEGGINEV